MLTANVGKGSAMKQLAVLSLVLGIFGASQAAFEMQWDASEQAVRVTTDLELSLVQEYFGITYDGQFGQVKPTGEGRPDIDDSSVTDFGVFGSWNQVILVDWADPEGESYAAGPWFWISVTSEEYEHLVLGDARDYVVQVSLLDGSFGAKQSLFLIPEPMSLALLGVGALLAAGRRQ